MLGLDRAFRDNFEMRQGSIRFNDLSSHQQAVTFDLISIYVNRMRTYFANLKMEEIRQHLNETHFAGMGSAN